MKRRVVAEVSAYTRRRGRPRLWAYSYADLAILFGMQEPAVRRAVADQRFDPTSLASIVDFANRRRVRGERLFVPASE